MLALLKTKVISEGIKKSLGWFVVTAVVIVGEDLVELETNRRSSGHKVKHHKILFSFEWLQQLLNEFIGS